MTNLYREHPTPTARMVNGSIEPHPLADAADTVVWLPLPPEPDGAVLWEGLRASNVDADHVRLAAVPLFAFNVHFGDEMSVTPSGEGPLVGTQIVRRGNFETFRAWLGDSRSKNLPDIIRRFGEMGCLIEGYSENLIGFGCSVDHAPSVVKALTIAEDNGELVWESGDQ